MIYDSKETLMDINGRLYVSEDGRQVLQRYEMDYDGLEEGKRYLAIPDGIIEISDTAFSEYNNSELMLFVQNRLVNPDQAREEWQKKLRSQRMIRITYPKEVGKSWFEKAEFMRKKELRVRFLRILLPESLQKIDPYQFPDLLEAIIVNEENPYFTSKDGVLYTHDMKTLVRFPGFRDTKPDFEIPDSVERIGRSAFKNACIRKLTIPDHIEKIDAGAFDGCLLEELVMPSKMETIEAGIFQNCDIRKLILPKDLKRIKSYAFQGTAGLTEIVAEGEMPEMEDAIFSNGYFRGIEWWPWKIIPKACFLNSFVRKILVPEGVEHIEDYAFAGCYHARQIVLPQSVTTIGKNSFDEGESYSADVTVPEHLLKYVYRFPALSKVNKMMKKDAWDRRTDPAYREDPDVLEKQQKAMQSYVDKIGVMQTMQKISYKQQIQFISHIKNADF